MDELKQLGLTVNAVGENAKDVATYLQMMSSEAQRLSQTIDACIRGTGNNQATEICSALETARSEMVCASHLLMQAWKLSQEWTKNQIPMDVMLIDSTRNVIFDSESDSCNDLLLEIDQDERTLPSTHEQKIMQPYSKITMAHTSLEDLKNTNPNWSENSPWAMNCQRCVSVYEARRRGYDVTAAPLLDSNDTLQIMRHPNGRPSVFVGGELVDCASNSGTGTKLLVDEKMSEWGEGARAIVRVRWKLGGGHVFVAEQLNGRTRYVDPQTGSVNVEYYFQSAKGNGTFCMRMDNLPFSERIHDCILRGESDDLY